MAAPQPTPQAHPNSHIGRLPVELNKNKNRLQFESQLKAFSKDNNSPKFNSAAKHTGYKISAIKMEITENERKLFCKKNQKTIKKSNSLHETSITKTANL